MLAKVPTPGSMLSSCYLSMPLCLSFQTCKSRLSCTREHVHTFPTVVRKVLKFLRTRSSVACSGRSSTHLSHSWAYRFILSTFFSLSVSQDRVSLVGFGVEAGENSLQRQKLKNESFVFCTSREVASSGSELGHCTTFI